MTAQSGLGRIDRFVADSAQQGRLVVQPRMGFSEVRAMRDGLDAVRNCDTRTIGTITLDSFTRVGDHDAARAALRSGAKLNGFPLVAHGPTTTRDVIADVHDDDFPIQVRHGSAMPRHIVEAVLESGLDGTEGGPVSYCLPYSRVPLREATDEWARCCDLIADAHDRGQTLHLETFGGCMLGQLCPPGLLIALSLAEGLFFQQRGVPSVSVSYAQQTNLLQDVAAVRALRRLATERLHVPWHTVVYTFMGVFPSSELGTYRLLRDSVLLATATNSERLIVKTPAEAHRIPSIQDNLAALEFAGAVAERRINEEDVVEEEELYLEASRILDAVLELHPDVGTALVMSFRDGVLDVPFCLHSDNANRARAVIDSCGRLRWSTAGGMPIDVDPATTRVTANRLLTMLHHNQQRFDRLVLPGWSQHARSIA